MGGLLGFNPELELLYSSRWSCFRSRLDPTIKCLKYEPLNQQFLDPKTCKLPIMADDAVVGMCIFLSFRLERFRLYAQLFVLTNDRTDYTLNNPDTLTKYKTAAQISNKVLEAVTGNTSSP